MRFKGFRVFPKLHTSRAVVDSRSFRKNSSVGTTNQRNMFNLHFSRQRVKIEHTFGLLKAKFESLRILRLRISDKKSHKFACTWIEACLVLHNILLKESDFDLFKIKDMTFIEDDTENPEFYVSMRGEEKRKMLFDYVIENF